MASVEPHERFLSRLKEAQIYSEQGLKDEAAEILKSCLYELETSNLAEADKKNLRSRIRYDLDKITRGFGAVRSDVGSQETEGPAGFTDPAQAFAYGMALMDGQFWEDAVQQFRQVAVVGHRVLEAWELCGDCAANQRKWEESIRYYEILYSNPLVPEDLKQRLLLKISRCSQEQKKITSKTVLKAPAVAVERDEIDKPKEATAASLDQTSISHLPGKRIRSLQNEKGDYLAGFEYSYRILNLLHVGMTSTIVELEREGTGERFAGQSLNEPYDRSVSPESIANWAYAQLMTDSPYIAEVFDLAHSEDMLFIVREYFPMTLCDLLSNGEPLSIPLSISLAYQILEGLGDLHLHMGRDKEIRKIYHLDLRPSRILLHDRKAFLKICNGGLWRVLEKSNPHETAIHKLPLAFLPYRAPEQFRPYLARRKPPVFTDIYLFGTLFYEMITGNPAFRAASFEEYEIQHCDQYPTPPKVWRPEIPEELSNLIMKCLESDPMRRWRSATQLCLLLEKLLGRYITMSRDDPFARYMKRHKPL